MGIVWWNNDLETNFNENGLKYMVSSILTTHVGSLPRSKELSELLFKKDKGESLDKNLFD